MISSSLSLSRYVCIYIYIYIHIHTYLPTYPPTYLPTYLPTYIHTYIHTYMHTYIHTYLVADTWGFNTNGAAAKVASLGRLGEKGTPWHFWEDKMKLTGVPKRSLCKTN